MEIILAFFSLAENWPLRRFRRRLSIASRAKSRAKREQRWHFNKYGMRRLRERLRQSLSLSSLVQKRDDDAYIAQGEEKMKNNANKIVYEIFLKE